MRIILVIFLIFISSICIGQKIEYRNDSLFVNNIYVNAQTNKEMLDNILDSKAKVKISKDDMRKNQATGKKVVRTTYFYYDLGLFFRKYDYDTTKLSIGIKLYRDVDPKEDRQKELTETFNGQLIIADNLINDKRQITELQALKNCRVTVDQVVLGSYKAIIGGDIIYQQNIIRLSFDKRTNELTSVFIHHNFKDR